MLVEACCRRVEGDRHERILFLSHSNRAVDHAFTCMKDLDGVAVTRVGHASRVVEANRPHIWNADSDGDRLFNVYFATIDTAATAQATNMDCDLVIIDEANKARLDEVLWAMSHGTSLVFVGDHNQLPPVEDELIRAVNNKSLTWDGSRGHRSFSVFGTQAYPRRTRSDSTFSTVCIPISRRMWARPTTAIWWTPTRCVGTSTLEPIRFPWPYTSLTQ